MSLTPTQLKALVKIPVVLYSPLRSGQISEVVARVYLGSPSATAEAKELNQAGNGNGAGSDPPGAAISDIGTLDGNVPSFQIPYESNLND